MIWIIVLAVILFILFKFIGSLSQDKSEIKNENLSEKFSLLVSELNAEIYDGKAQITVLDQRSFNLYEVGSNEILQFFYSSGSLNLSWRCKQANKEIVCKQDYYNLREISDPQQKKIAREFLSKISIESAKHQVLNEKLANVLELFDASQNEIDTGFDNDKFTISTYFYKFFFAKETVQMLLGDDEKKLLISKALILSTWEKEKLIERLFKRYLELNRVSLKTVSYQLFQFNSFEFFMQEFKVSLDKNDTYFEVLYQDINNVIDKDGSDLAVANYFIIYVKAGIPDSIFVIVTDPFIGKLAIRKLHASGMSTKVAFTVDYDEAIEFLKEHVSE